MIAAPDAMPRMNAGMMNWETCAHGLTLNSVNWMGGLQPHQIAGKITTSVAIQNPGIERPRIARLRAT